MECAIVSARFQVCTTTSLPGVPAPPIEPLKNLIGSPTMPHFQQMKRMLLVGGVQAANRPVAAAALQVFLGHHQVVDRLFLTDDAVARVEQAFVVRAVAPVQALRDVADRHARCGGGVIGVYQANLPAGVPAA